MDSLTFYTLAAENPRRAYEFRYTPTSRTSAIECAQCASSYVMQKNTANEHERYVISRTTLPTGGPVRCQNVECGRELEYE